MCVVDFNLHIVGNIAPSGFCNSTFSAVMLCYVIVDSFEVFV